MQRAGESALVAALRVGLDDFSHSSLRVGNGAIACASVASGTWPTPAIVAAGTIQRSSAANKHWATADSNTRTTVTELPLELPLSGDERRRGIELIPQQVTEVGPSVGLAGFPPQENLTVIAYPEKNPAADGVRE